MRDDLLVTIYRDREIEAKIKISDAEIDNFITDRNRAGAGGGVTRSTPAAKGEPEEIDVAQIFIPIEAGSSAAVQALSHSRSLASVVL